MPNGFAFEIRLFNSIEAQTLNLWNQCVPFNPSGIVELIARERERERKKMSKIHLIASTTTHSGYRQQ